MQCSRDSTCPLQPEILGCIQRFHPCRASQFCPCNVRFRPEPVTARAFLCYIESMDAKNYAFWLLGRRAYSEKRLRDKLRQKKYPEGDIEQIIKYCLERKFLNDLEYAKSFIRTRLSLRPRGQRVLRLELLKRGISDENIKEALASKDTNQASEVELALRLVEQKRFQYAGIDEQTRNRRLFALLARRGFSISIIKEVINDIATEEADT